MAEPTLMDKTAPSRSELPNRRLDGIEKTTVEKVKRHCSDGVATVEMEASALFAVGAYRGVSVTSVFAISDILADEDWDQGYHSEEKLESLRTAYEAALESIATRVRNVL